jgi:alpha-beta hydrolase superfamily lysophospholipase
VSRRTRFALGTLIALLGVGAFGYRQLPAVGAGALLHPHKSRSRGITPRTCEATTFMGAGITLKGWRCHTTAPRRGSIVWLHGIADNHESGGGLVERFGQRGFDVVAYDSRANGESGGDACTYGYYEKQDLQQVISTMTPGPVVLIGASLGGAVALQEAADDPRITAVVAAETFSDLRTVATERTPALLRGPLLKKAFDRAEVDGHFSMDAVSPVHAAGRIHVPVLLIHGEADVDTRPEHSRRIFEALEGPKRLILVPGATHNQSLRSEVWAEIDRWLDQVVSLRGVLTR